MTSTGQTNRCQLRHRRNALCQPPAVPSVFYRHLPPCVVLRRGPPKSAVDACGDVQRGRDVPAEEGGDRAREVGVVVRDRRRRRPTVPEVARRNGACVRREVTSADASASAGSRCPSPAAGRTRRRRHPSSPPPPATPGRCRCWRQSQGTPPPRPQGRPGRRTGPRRMSRTPRALGAPRRSTPARVCRGTPRPPPQQSSPPP